ncbi:MAG: DNA alkylation repair protein [Myxococcaceae bacterium]
MSALLKEVRAVLVAAADPKRAPQMQAYMKSVMPYHGVAAGPMRAAVKPLVKAHPVEDFETWREDVLALWNGAKFREERYAALVLLKDKRVKKFTSMKMLPLYEELIVSGAWWDFVDEIAAHCVGDLLAAEPAAMKKAMRQWSVDEDMWKRRTSIICQLRFKEQIDLKLLYDCIEPSLEGPKAHPLAKQFFIRKAIGWALRQHAWTDPAEVKRYVAAHQGRLSGLSVREALKNT